MVCGILCFKVALTPVHCFFFLERKVLVLVVVRNMMDQNVLSSGHMAFGPRDLVWFDLMNVSGTFGGHVCSSAYYKF